MKTANACQIASRRGGLHILAEHPDTAGQSASCKSLLQTVHQVVCEYHGPRHSPCTETKESLFGRTPPRPKPRRMRRSTVFSTVMAT
jgi:hypothetical protein